MDAGKDFIEMHKKAFQALKKEYWTAENKKLILSKKKDLEKFFELAKAEIMEANTTLKEHGIDVKTIGDKVESIYTEKKSMLETLAKSEAAQSAKRKLAAYVKKIKASL